MTLLLQSNLGHAWGESAAPAAGASTMLLLHAGSIVLAVLARLLQ